MALCHKWDVKNDFAYVLQFFSLISDGLGVYYTVLKSEKKMGSHLLQEKRNVRDFFSMAFV